MSDFSDDAQREYGEAMADGRLTPPSPDPQGDDELRQKVRKVLMAKPTRNLWRTSQNDEFPVPNYEDDFVELIQAELINQRERASHNCNVADDQPNDAHREDEQHNTELGWCCACEADIAFLHGEIEDAREQARQEVREEVQAILRGNEDDQFGTNYEERGTYPSKAAAKRAVDDLTEPTDAQGDDELSKEIYAAIHDGVTLSTDGGQPYLTYTDDAEDMILTIIAKQREQARQEALLPVTIQVIKEKERERLLDELEAYIESAKLFGVDLFAVQGFITAKRTAPAEGENTEWLSENHKKRLRKYREKMGEKT